MRGLSILAIGAQLAAAIQFTNPAENSTLTKGSTFDLEWSTVDTDPSSFSVYLVNFVNWPPSYTLLDLDLETSSGEASVRIPCDVDNSYGYQFNAINGTNVYVIYAQTPKFSITGDSCTDPVITSPATCAAATATATVTVTVRGNSSSVVSAGGYATTQRAAFAGGNSTSSSSSASVTTSTYEGECPTTIGWNGAYTNPVTLTSVPHAGRAVATPTATATPSGFQTVSTGSVKTKGASKCSSKRQSRKRHSDGGHRAPFPRKR